MIDAEDTDVIVIAAYVSTIWPEKLIFYRTKQQIKCSDLCLNEVANILTGFHNFTGTNGAGFYRQSKKTVFKKIQANTESRRLLYRIGRKKKHLNEKDIAEIIKFVTKFT